MSLRLRKFPSVAVALLLTYVAYGQQPSAAASSHPARRFLMWKVSSPSATVYLVGSIHLARKDIYPLPPPVEAAFASSKILAVEVNIKNLDPASAATFLQQYGLYGSGDALSKHLPQDTAAALEAFCSKYGIPRASFEPMKPWVVAMVVSVMPFQREGANPDSGIDMHFLNEVKLPQRIAELETADYQLKLLSSGSEAEHLQLLASSLKLVDKSDDMERAYLSADVDAMLKQLSSVEPKAYFKRLTEDRNPGMANHVEQYLKGSEQCFVVIGAGHLIGDNGVIKLLQNKGFHVEQLAFDWK